MSGYTRNADAGLRKARAGSDLRMWVDDKKPGADGVVLTDATLCYDVEEGFQVVVRGARIALNSVSDHVHMCMIWCTGTGGTGGNTQVSGHLDIHSSGNLAGSEHVERKFDPPIVLKYSDGVRSITCWTSCNDTSVEISAGWEGWKEKETLYPGDE